MGSKQPKSDTVQQVQQVQQHVALTPVAGGATGLISIKPVASTRGHRSKPSGRQSKATWVAPAYALPDSKAGRLRRLLGTVPGIRVASDLQNPPAATQLELFTYRPCPWELE